MSTKPQSKKKIITVTQVCLAALFLAAVGGLYGFYTGGPVSMIIGFAEWFIAGFVFSYIIASFLVLLHR